MEKEQKKLQKQSEYAQYDLDGDGVVSDVVHGVFGNEI